LIIVAEMYAPAGIGRSPIIAGIDIAAVLGLKDSREETTLSAIYVDLYKSARNIAKISDSMVSKRVLLNDSNIVTAIPLPKKGSRYITNANPKATAILILLITNVNAIMIENINTIISKLIFTIT